jgi:hypothetical protein
MVSKRFVHHPLYKNIPLQYRDFPFNKEGVIQATTNNDYYICFPLSNYLFKIPKAFCHTLGKSEDDINSEISNAINNFTTYSSSNIINNNVKFKSKQNGKITKVPRITGNVSRGTRFTGEAMEARRCSISIKRGHKSNRTADNKREKEASSNCNAGRVRLKGYPEPENGNRSSGGRVETTQSFGRGTVLDSSLNIKPVGFEDWRKHDGKEIAPLPNPIGIDAISYFNMYQHLPSIKFDRNDTNIFKILP